MKKKIDKFATKKVKNRHRKFGCKKLHIIYAT